MKKTLAVVILSCLCSLCLCAGCSSSSSSSDTSASASSANTASVSTGSSSSSDSAAASDSSSSSTSESSTAEKGTVEASIQQATDSGVTKLSADELQALMDDGLDVNMTLSEVREKMGCDGTAMGSDYAANTYAFYASDKSKAIICTFDGGDTSSKMTSCEINID